MHFFIFNIQEWLKIAYCAFIFMHIGVSTWEIHFDGLIEEEANGCLLQSSWTYLDPYNQILDSVFIAKIILFS